MQQSYWIENRVLCCIGTVNFLKLFFSNATLTHWGVWSYIYTHKIVNVLLGLRYWVWLVGWLVGRLAGGWLAIYLF